MRAALPLVLVFACSGAFLASRPPAWALDPGRGLTQYGDRSWGVRDGLPQASVTALAQTPDGFLWIGTDGGLARFDGQRFSVFDSGNVPALRIHRIRALLADSLGDLWIGAEGGAGVLRYRGGRFETFEHLGVRGFGVSTLFADPARSLWAGAWWGAMTIDDRGAVRHTRLAKAYVGPVLAMAQDQAGALWLGGLLGLLRYEGGQARRFSAADGFPRAAVTALRAAPDGGVWIATDNEGLLRFHEGRFDVVPDDGAAKQRLTSLLLDRDGTLWVTGQRGLGRVRAGRLEWAPPGSALALPANTVIEDREENLWVGRVAAGVLRVNEGTFTALPPERFEGRRTTAVLATRDGAIWVASEGGGVTRVQDGVYRTYRMPVTGPGLCTDDVWAMAEDATGAVWFGGTGRGPVLCRLSPDHETFRSFGADDGIHEKDIHAIAPQPDGTVVIGSGVGVFIGREDRFTRVPDPPKRPLHNVTTVHRDHRGHLWISANALFERTPEGGWRRLIDSDGLSNIQIYAIDEDRHGRLWLGTKTGFTRIENGRITAWKRQQGFLDDPVFKVLVDGNDNLWLSSSKGVFRVTAQAIAAFDADPKKPLAYVHYDSDDGLKTDQCEGGRQSAGARTASGILWFATARGAAFVDPRRLPSPGPAPSVVVSSIRLDGNSLSPTADHGWLAQAGGGDVLIDYTAPWLTRPEALRFRYRLEPFDRGWVDAGTRRLAIYTKVPPGSYRFGVVAVSDRFPGDFLAETTVNLVLTPRWYQTVAARVGMFASAGGLLVLAAWLWHRRRLRVVEDRHAAVLSERNRIARDLHDTLAQGFTGISVQLEAAVNRLPPQATQARENLDQARSLVRASLVDARRAVWDLRPVAAGRAGLVEALSQIARTLSAEVPVRVQVSGVPRALPPPFELALVRIGQEALTNALRHARASNIAIEISFLDDGVHLRVSDDGRGFHADHPGNPQSPDRHLGLEGIQERARAINAALAVRSQPGAGTELTLRAPYPAREAP